MNFSVRVSAVKNAENSKVKAYGDVTFAGEIKVTNISLVENAHGGMFVSMPRYKSSEIDENGNTVYKDICNPITKDFRDALCGALLDAYKEAKESGQSATKEITDLRPEDDGSLQISAKVYPVKKEGIKSLAYAKIVLGDAFIINNVSVMEGKNGPFVAMPSYKSKTPDENGNAVYKDICYPITKEARERVRELVLAEYKKAKETSKDCPQGDAQGRSPDQEKQKTSGDDDYINASVPEWMDFGKEELPFPSEEQAERKELGHIKFKPSERKTEKRNDTPIKITGEDRGR